MNLMILGAPSCTFFDYVVQKVFFFPKEILLGFQYAIFLPKDPEYTHHSKLIL